MSVRAPAVRGTLCLGVILALGAVRCQEAPRLEVESWGAPWTERFEIRLLPSRELVVARLTPRFDGSEPLRREARRRLDEEQAARLLAAAAEVLAVGNHSRHCTALMDGSSIRVLLPGSEPPEFVCTSYIQPFPEVERLLARINEHLPEDDHVY